MKKILSGLVLLSFLALLVSPLMVSRIASAVETAPGQQPNQCCVIRHTIEPISPDTGNVTKGSILGPAITATCDLGTPTQSQNWAAYCLLDTVLTVTDWIFWMAFVIAAAVIVAGGIMFMTAGGNPDRTTKAKQILTFGIIGIAVAVIAKFIPGIVRFFVGM